MWGKNLGTAAGVHLTRVVRLIWGPLNTGFTVSKILRFFFFFFNFFFFFSIFFFFLFLIFFY